MASLIGQTLDKRYVIEEQLGAGGMGVVFKARHAILGNSVAIKILNAEHSADPDLAKRFVREAKHSFALDHPNCVRVTDFGAAEDGTLYMVMEHLKGRTIYDEVTLDGPMESRRVAHIGKQVASALLGAHEKGLIHRDLKPANIMLSHKSEDPDFVKVFDFGLARLFDQQALGTVASISPLTQEGIDFGTPDYMSPEQALGQKVEPSSDVYALGICLYEMLCGEVPFTGEAFTVILSKHVKDPPQPPSQRGLAKPVDPELEALILACLEKEADRRPPLSDLIGALDRISHKRARPSSPISADETVELFQEGIICANPPPAVPHPEPPGITEAIVVGVRQNRVPQLLLAGLLLAGLAALLVLFVGGDSESEQESAPTEPAPALVDTLEPVPVASHADAAPVPAPRPPDASLPPDAAPSADLDTKPKPPTSHKKNLHLERAEEAHRQKNTLKQLAEANAALRQMPKNRRAAYLVGDALMKSGDKVRACTYFKRSSKKHYRAAGCGD